MMKLGLDGIEIRKNICVIELDIVDHQGLGPVMDELGPLVEKRRVVFIGLDHKKAPLAQTGRHTKVIRHTAN